jgi:iron-sulfur cluster insertion protein
MNQMQTSEIVRPFGFTESAGKQIRKLIEQDPGEGVFMRVAVLGGGCSGFQYNFSFDDEMRDDDLVFEAHGTKVVVDDVSIDLLGGSVLDYKDELIGSYFAVENPNASSSCGCGTSFAI